MYGSDTPRAFDGFTGPAGPSGRPDHYASLYESHSEKYATAGAFLDEGLERGHRCYCWTEQRRDEALAGLRSAGVAVEEALESGSLVVVDGREVYLTDGEFTVDAAVEALRSIVREGASSPDHDGVCLVGDPTGLVEDGVATTGFLEYEERVNREVFGDYDALGLCLYDESVFDESDVEGVLRTHPCIAGADGATVNRYYEPEETNGSTATDRLRALQDRTAAEPDLDAVAGSLRAFSEATGPTAGDAEAVFEHALDVWERVLSPTAVGVWRFDGTADDASLAVARTGEAVTDDPTTLLEPFVERAFRSFVRNEPVVTAEPDERPGVDQCVFVPLQRGGAIAAVDRQGERFPDAALDVAAAVGATVDTALSARSDRAALETCEAELDRTTERIRQRTRLRTIESRVDRAVRSSSTREELAAAVCDAVMAAEAFEFAWLGGIDRTAGAVVPMARRGDGQGYLDVVSLDLDADEPAVRAGRSGDPAVVRDVSTHRQRGPWRHAALSRQFRSVLAVPVSLSDRRYGVLGVYADRQSAFDERLRSVLTEIGERVAFGFAALDRTHALAGDRLVELVFDVRDDQCPTLRLADRADCRLELEGVVRKAADLTYADATVRASTPAAVAEAAGGSVAVADARPVEDDVVRLEFARPSLAAVLAEHGAALSEMTVDPDVARATVELPHAADVTEIAAVVTTTFPDSELVAKHVRERPNPVADAVERGRLDLTDRQEEVLRAAHRAGYFERSRRTDGEAVAESLDITSATFHEHRRRAIDQLLDATFEET
jgi:predicted DNA binding protein